MAQRGKGGGGLPSAIPLQANLSLLHQEGLAQLPEPGACDPAKGTQPHIWGLWRTSALYRATKPKGHPGGVSSLWPNLNVLPETLTLSPYSCKWKNLQGSESSPCLFGIPLTNPSINSSKVMLPKHFHFQAFISIAII